MFNRHSIESTFARFNKHNITNVHLYVMFRAFFLVVRLLTPPLLVVRPLKKNNFFCGSPYIFEFVYFDYLYDLPTLLNLLQFKRKFLSIKALGSNICVIVLHEDTIIKLDFWSAQLFLFLLSVPKFTAKLYCLCLSLPQIYT